MRGPYSLAELRSLLDSGALGAGDLIGVETWLPVATLAGLLAAAPSTAAAAAAVAAPTPASPGSASISLSGDGTGVIQVDKEFQL